MLLNSSSTTYSLQAFIIVPHLFKENLNTEKHFHWNKLGWKKYSMEMRRWKKQKHPQNDYAIHYNSVLRKQRVGVKRGKKYVITELNIVSKLSQK